MNEDKLTSVVPEAVRELLEQRSTYREWLSRLDEVGDEYRSEVAERVRADYQGRLDGVGEELAGHRHELVASLERRRGRLDELSEAFERHSAELEEAELRFQVGEFDDTAWEETRANLAESLEEIEGELGEARSAVDELERVLGELGSGSETMRDPARAEPSAAGADETTGPAEAAEPAEPAEASPEEKAEPPAAGKAKETPEAADVEAAEESADAADVPADAEVAASVGSGAADRPTDGPDGGGEDYLDELEFLESLSLDDPDSFDAVSRMLDDEEDR